MKRRVARLLEEGQEPTRILAVTFTRTAAKDLVKDLHGLGQSGCENIQAGTLHSACFRMLNRGAVFHYNQRHARPLLAFELEALLHDIKGPFGGKRKTEARLAAFEAAWARLQTDEPGWAVDPADQAFQHALLDWLRFHRAMHIGEVVPLALDYLRNNPESEELSAFDHIIVDEYQDLNKAEQILISLLAGNAHCAVVGDIDQSIYAFRHARPEGILDFSRIHPDTQDEELVECRRCPKKVVAMADSLIRKNHGVGTPPRLRELAGKPDGDVAIVQWRTLEDETAGIAAYVKARIDSGECTAKDFLVLSPRRKMGQDLRQKLIESGVEAHSFFSEEILESPEAKQAFSLLSLVADPADRVSLRFLLGCESGSWYAGEYAKLRARSYASETPPRDLLEEVVAGRVSIPGITHLVERYRVIRAKLESLTGLNGRALLDALFPEADEWAKAIRSAVAEGTTEETLPRELKQEIIQIATQPDMPAAGEFVRIMSLHKSKGLSSKVVVVQGCFEGVLPHVDPEATDLERDRQIQEQRRLFYVAMTRATDTLILSSVTQVARAVAYPAGIAVPMSRRPTLIARMAASRFLGELGPTAPAPVTGEEFLTRRTQPQAA